MNNPRAHGDSLPTYEADGVIGGLVVLIKSNDNHYLVIDLSFFKPVFVLFFMLTGAGFLSLAYVILSMFAR